MKKTLLLLAILAMTSCASTSRVQMPISAELPTGFNCDNTFRLFWLEYTEEANQCASLSKYTPSSKMLDRYTIIKNKKDYCLVGYITINEDFAPDKSKHLKVDLTRQTAEIYSFECPLKTLPLFIQQQGIVYLEMSKKVSKR